MARRKLIWARMPRATTTLTRINGSTGGGIETADLLADFRTLMGVTAGPVGLTVMRIRLFIEWRADQTNDSISIQANGLYYGIKVMDLLDASTQETTEVPARGPMLSPHDDWMAWGQVNTKSALNIGAPSYQYAGWSEIDVRSMRKIDELGQTLVLQVQSTLPTAGATPSVLSTTSVLLALP